MTNYHKKKKQPNPTAHDEKDISSKTHMHSWSSVKSDMVSCPKVLTIYWEKKNTNIRNPLLKRNLKLTAKTKELKGIFWN